MSSFKSRPVLDGERWLPTQYKSYDVSDHGRVWSATAGILPTSYWGQNPHPFVELRVDKERVRRLLHHLVLESFRGPRPPGACGLHWDDDPENNHLTNLRWGTKSDNGHDAVRNGKDPQRKITHCPAEHEYTEENTWWYRGWRYCRQCRRERSKLKKQQIRNANAIINLPVPEPR